MKPAETLVQLTSQEARLLATIRRDAERLAELIGDGESADIHEAVARDLDTLAANPEESSASDQSLTAGDVEILAGLHDMLAATLRKTPWRDPTLVSLHAGRAAELRELAAAARKNGSNIAYWVSV